MVQMSLFLKGTNRDTGVENGEGEGGMDTEKK